MIGRPVTYIAILEYFRMLADNHSQIQSFIGYSPLALQSKISSMKGLETPTLVLYDYEGRLDGNNQRTIAQRTISFALVESVKHGDDFDGQYESISVCEGIGLSVLSRINFESKKSDLKWLYNNFVKDSVRFNEIKLKGKDGMFGMQFSFDLRISEPLVINPCDWKDIKPKCK